MSHDAQVHDAHASGDEEIVELEAVRPWAPASSGAPPAPPLPIAYPAGRARSDDLQGEREKPRRSSGRVWTFAGIILGGVAGSLLGLIILWVVFRKDPLRFFSPSYGPEIATADAGPGRASFDGDRVRRKPGSGKRADDARPAGGPDRSAPSPEAPGSGEPGAGTPSVPGREVAVTVVGPAEETPQEEEEPDEAAVFPPTAGFGKRPSPEMPPPGMRFPPVMPRRFAPPGGWSIPGVEPGAPPPDPPPIAPVVAEVVDEKAGEEPRLPVPTKEELAAAMGGLEKTFEEELAAADTPAKQADLAATLAANLDDWGDDPATRFVLLQKSCELATKACDLVLVERAIDELTREFRVNPSPLRAQAFAGLNHWVRTDTMREELTDASIRASLAAATAGEALEARKLASIAREQPMRKADWDQVDIVRLLEQEVESRLARLAQFQAAKAAYEAKPDDANAAEAYGRMLCFRNEDWARGVPLLAKSEDPQIREAAEKDQRVGMLPSELVEVADAWYLISQRGGVDQGFAHRARRRYLEARPRLDELDRVRVQERLQEMALFSNAESDAMLPYEPGGRKQVPLVYAPVRNDLWDDSQGTKVIVSSDVLPGADIKSAFGGARSRTPFGSDVMFFAEAPGETVHFVEWEIDRYVTVRRAVLNLRCDPKTPDHGRASAIRLLAWNVKSNAWDELLKLDGFGQDYRTPKLPEGWTRDPAEEEGHLALNAPVAQVTARRFRAEFVQDGARSRVKTFLGPMIVELDAYAN